MPLQINVDPQATSQPVVEDKEQAQKMRKAVVELPYRFCAPCQMRRICTVSDSITR